MRKIVAILAVGGLLALAWAQGTPAGRPASRLATCSSPADLSAIAGWKGRAPGAAGGFRFVIMGDRTGSAVEGAWDEAVADVNRLHPDFVMSVGDYIEGFCATEAAAQAEWDEVDKITRTLDAPFFYCPGNHDIYGDMMRKLYLKLHATAGRAYYAFDYRGCHFVVLDSCGLLYGESEGENKESPQWEWLKADLAGAAARAAGRVFIFSHHPLYDSREWKRLRAMIDPARTTFFSGHWHTYSLTHPDGVDYYVLSGTANIRGGGWPEHGQFNALLHVVVDGGKPTIAVVPVGQLRPHDFITTSEYRPAKYKTTAPAE